MKKGQTHIEFEKNSTLLQIADKLVAKNLEVMRHAKSEEDLRIGFEKALEPLLEIISVKSHGKYERSIYLGGRADARHGQVIIEYEKPGAFKSNKWVEHAFEQLVGYIDGIAQSHKELLFVTDPKLVGVGFDGEKIFFVQYKGDKEKVKVSLDKKDFSLIGPYEFNRQSASTLLTYFRSLSRQLLTAENLADVFGPKSELAKKAVSAFADALDNWDSYPRIRTFYNEWKRLFGIVYGEHFNAQQAEEAEKLSKYYKVGKETDFQELLFCVHTYFVFLMKLIAAELLNISETAYKSSFSDDLYHSDKKQLIAKITDIEEGGVYKRRGINNFLEGDFFRWYLDAIDSPRLEDAIREIAKTFSEFEPATVSIKPEVTKDLLKKLYQYLVPQEVRHKLGEYYTPDWLAELLINDVGYDGDTRKRFLDPACGSGTFLVLAIHKAKEYAKNEKEHKIETAKRITKNVWGFDLNPLAVIASRTNYLFALGDLVDKLESFEIPVYLADSVLWPEKKGQIDIEFVEGLHILVQTSVGKFHIPQIWIKDEGLLMHRAAPLIEEMIKARYSEEHALERFKKEGLVFPPHENIVMHFYKEIMDLENQQRNGIWARFLKNVFAPMMANKFDYVVGNPPWIRWDYLSQDYRNATLKMWKDYGLFSLRGFETKLGGAKKDFSMLFTYASADYYLADKGKLAFLITQEVFKSKGAGEGFRRFKLGEQGKYLCVYKAHDLTSIQPFEGAANKTAAILLKKGEKTVYPLTYVVWHKKKGYRKIQPDAEFEFAMKSLIKEKLGAAPLGSELSSWQTISEKTKNLSNLKGKNHYKAILGANPNPYGVFWLEIKQVLSDGLVIVRNMAEEGKKAIQIKESKIESELIYPALRGSDIERWGYNVKINMLVVQDPITRNGYAEEVMRSKYPNTYNYLVGFKDELLSRALYKKYHEHTGNPFYSQFNISEETFAKYKVIWKRMSNDITCTVVSSEKTVYGFKPVISFETTALFAVSNENEAHYLCALINSRPVREFIKSYTSGGRGFGTPAVMKSIGISNYNPKNKYHAKLSELSLKLHKLKTNSEEEKIQKLEEEVDVTVKSLYNIN